MLKKVCTHVCAIWSALIFTSLLVSGTASAASCLVNYHFFSTWPGGFQAEATITNLTPDQINGWNISWTFQNGETVRDGWHGVFTWNGQNVTVTNPVDYNNVIPANGGSINIAFNGIGDNPALLDSEAFTLNGMQCGEGQNPNNDLIDIRYEVTSSPVNVIEDGVIIGKKFNAKITITNLTDDPIDGWTLQWRPKNDEKVTSGSWLSNVSQDVTGMVTAVNRWWNRTIPAHGSVVFNFEVMSPPEVSIAVYDLVDFIFNDVRLFDEKGSFTVTKSGCGMGTNVKVITVDSTPDDPNDNLYTSCRTMTPNEECNEMVIPLIEEYEFDAFPIWIADHSGIILSRFAGWAVNGTPVDNMENVDLQDGDVVDAKFDCGNDRVDNPYTDESATVDWYIDSSWRDKVLEQAAGESTDVADKMTAVADTPTAIWLDSIASISNLEGHLDAALAQHALSGNPVVVTVVIYDMPNRDCAANASAGEIHFSDAALAAISPPPGNYDYDFSLAISELPGIIDRYRTEFLDPIAEIIGKRKYEDLRIVTIIEPDSLPNMATNITTDGFDKNGDGYTDDILAPRCVASNNGVVHPFSGSGPDGSWDYGDKQEASVQYDSNGYVEVIQMALGAFSEMSNVYRYLDIGHSGWLGWDNNVNETVKLYVETVTHNGWGQYMPSRFDGIVSNVSGYTPLEEVYLPDPNLSVANASNLYGVSGSFYDWNKNFDELDYHETLYAKFSDAGFDDIGILIDTSRNGWGGSARPTSAPSDPENWNLNDYLDATRLDRRSDRGNFCNITGAGLGERPQAAPAIPGHTYEELPVDAYVWVKPPGESDGTSDLSASRFDPLCGQQPVWRNSTKKDVATDAMPNAPEAGEWFNDQFRMLINNAYPTITP